MAEKELPFWLRYERGGGGALLKAAKTLKRGYRPWQSDYARDYFNAGGNGAAMRILPHVIASAEKSDIKELMLEVAKDTRITHGHPRAFLGAACYAYALDYLLKKDCVLEYGELVETVLGGQNEWGAPLDPCVFGDWINTARQFCSYDFSAEWSFTRERMANRLKYIQDSLKKGLILDDRKVLTELECFTKVNGAGDVAALAAIYLSSRYANNPSLGIKIPAFSYGADTDTIASMTGGLLGMLSGTSWIPIEWQIVQDYDCLIRMAELLLANNKKEIAGENSAKAGVQKIPWTLTPIGKMKLVDSKHVPNGKNGDVIIENHARAGTLHKNISTNGAFCIGLPIRLPGYTKPADHSGSSTQANVYSRELADIAANSQSRIKRCYQAKAAAKFFPDIDSNCRFIGSS